MKTLLFLCVLVAGTNAGVFYTGLFGHSGIVNNNGKNVQFTREQADNIVLIGPSGVVTKDGNNKQRIVKRSAVGYVNNQGSIGLVGRVLVDGTIEAFTPEFIDDIVVIGPGGVVTKSGKNVQLDENLNLLRTKRSTDEYGHSVAGGGIVTNTGKQFQLPHGVTVVAAGPSGAVLSNGENIQY